MKEAKRSVRKRVIRAHCTNLLEAFGLEDTFPAAVRVVLVDGRHGGWELEAGWCVVDGVCVVRRGVAPC